MRLLVAFLLVIVSYPCKSQFINRIGKTESQIIKELSRDKSIIFKTRGHTTYNDLTYLKYQPTNEYLGPHIYYFDKTFVCLAVKLMLPNDHLAYHLADIDKNDNYTKISEYLYCTKDGSVFIQFKIIDDEPIFEINFLSKDSMKYR